MAYGMKTSHQRGYTVVVIISGVGGGGCGGGDGGGGDGGGGDGG